MQLNYSNSAEPKHISTQHSHDGQHLRSEQQLQHSSDSQHQRDEHANSSKSKYFSLRRIYHKSIIIL